MNLFLTRARELERTRLIQSGYSPSWSFNFDRMQGLRFSSTEPDEEDLRSFLITFRQFVSERDPIFLNRVYNLCQQHLRSDELKRLLVTSRRALRTSQQHGGIQFVFNDKNITPEYVADLWINGWYFHNDYEKRRKLERLMPHEFIMVRQRFLAFIAGVTVQIFYVANIINAALKEGLLREE
jgi:hypothetical protein